jgi:hypothetical protein
LKAEEPTPSGSLSVVSTAIATVRCSSEKDNNKVIFHKVEKTPFFGANIRILWFKNAKIEHKNSLSLGKNASSLSTDVFARPKRANCAHGFKGNSNGTQQKAMR